MQRGVRAENDGCIKLGQCRGGGEVLQSRKRTQALRLLRGEGGREASEGKQGRRQIGQEQRDKHVPLGGAGSQDGLLLRKAVGFKTTNGM